jgi:hypothetical protein
VNLSTAGPAVTVETGSRALVGISAQIKNNSSNSSFMSVTVSGASSSAANDDRALRHRDGTGTDGIEGMSHTFLFTTLTPGTNTFTAKYRALAGTATFESRHLWVIPF